MSETTSRTELLLGKDSIARLAEQNILVVGVGGVGGYAVEMLGRAGIGHMTLVDGDNVEPSNLNRQIAALTTTIGCNKAQVMAERIKQINPGIEVRVIPQFITEEDVCRLLDSRKFTFIVDAIDSVGAKCRLITEAFAREIPIISSMGAGARTKASEIHIEKLSRTHHDGLSKAVRKRLAGTKIPDRLDVVFSNEQADPEAVLPRLEGSAKGTVGTVSWIPAMFGCHIAQYVVLKITGK